MEGNQTTDMYSLWKQKLKFYYVVFCFACFIYIKNVLPEGHLHGLDAGRLALQLQLKTRNEGN